MNILPKKRWHVRTKDNVARVRRDEAQAAAEEKSRLERAALAEQEARTRLLRERASSKKSAEVSGFYKPVEEDKDPLGVEASSGHVNFFAELEEQERTFGSNKEHENEKRLEKEAEERKIGLLKYLGEGSSEYMKEVPWYKKLPQKTTTASENGTAMESENKTKLPPSQTMNRTPVATKSDKIIFPSEIAPLKRKKHKKHKSKKSKKRKHKSGEDESDSDPETVSPPSVDMEKLRAERLMREKQERLKTERLLLGDKLEAAASKAVEPKYEQKYSCQFNPEIARQNRV